MSASRVCFTLADRQLLLSGCCASRQAERRLAVYPALPGSSVQLVDAPEVAAGCPRSRSAPSTRPAGIPPPGRPPAWATTLPSPEGLVESCKRLPCDANQDRCGGRSAAARAGRGAASACAQTPPSRPAAQLRCNRWKPTAELLRILHVKHVLWWVCWLACSLRKGCQFRGKIACLDLAGVFSVRFACEYSMIAIFTYKALQVSTTIAASNSNPPHRLRPVPCRSRPVCHTTVPLLVDQRSQSSPTPHSHLHHVQIYTHTSPPRIRSISCAGRGGGGGDQ